MFFYQRSFPWLIKAFCTTYKLSIIGYHNVTYEPRLQSGQCTCLPWQWSGFNLQLRQDFFFSSATAALGSTSLIKMGTRQFTKFGGDLLGRCGGVAHSVPLCLKWPIRELATPPHYVMREENVKTYHFILQWQDLPWDYLLNKKSGRANSNLHNTYKTSYRTTLYMFCTVARIRRN